MIQPVDKQIKKINIVLCCLLITLCFTTHAWGDTCTVEVNQPPKNPRKDVYCGMKCMYTLLRLSGKNIDFRELLKPEYIGSKEGSSLVELFKTAQDFGLNAKIVHNLTSRELRASPYPIILHVKANPKDNRYNHYMLFLRDHGEKAKIFNPPNSPEIMPYYELAPQWDGTGLIVSPEIINLSKVFAPAKKQFALFAAMAIAAILLIRTAGKYLLKKTGNISRPINFGLSIAQSAGLVIIALFGGVILLECLAPCIDAC